MGSDKKIIRHVKDLPTWYDLKKYHGLSEISISSWYDLLTQRKTHLFYLGSGHFEIYNRNESTVFDVLLQSRKDPLHHLKNDLEIFEFGGGKLEALKHDSSNFNEMSFGISPMTLRQLYMIENWFDDDVKKRVRDWVDKLNRGAITFKKNFEFDAETKWIKSFFHEPISDSLGKHSKLSDDMSEMSSGYVYIDYSLPNKILVKQFEQFITEHRIKYPETVNHENHKYPNINKWIEYGILPYFDLKIWEIQTGNSIPNRVFADAIFPGGEKGEEMVRKTTKKIADSIMSDGYLNFLSTIVAQENRKENY